MTIFIKIAILILQLIYAVLKLLPVRNKVVLISRQSDSPSIDFRLLKDEIKKQHPDYQVVMLCKMLDGGIGRKISYCFHILTQMYHMATAKAVILDSYCIAASVLTHRKSLLIIQMWHSVGTMKKFGYSILDKPEGPSSKIAHLMKMHRNYSYVLCAGDGYVDHLAEGFNVDKSIIKIFPLPRIELLQNEEYIEKKKKEIFARYSELNVDPDSSIGPAKSSRDDSIALEKKNDGSSSAAGKKNIVYVPTFRASDDAEFEQAVKDFADSLDFSKYNLIVKAHPLAGIQSTGRHIGAESQETAEAAGATETEESAGAAETAAASYSYKNDSRIITAPEFSSMDMLLIADAVVSDYSCIIYEAAVLMKPLYFYTYDYDSYMSTRDIYMDYKNEVPGPMCSDGRSLADAINKIDDYDYDRLSSFLKKYVSVTGHETEDIVKFLFSKM